MSDVHRLEVDYFAGMSHSQRRAEYMARAMGYREGNLQNLADVINQIKGEPRLGIRRLIMAWEKRDAL